MNGKDIYIKIEGVTRKSHYLRIKLLNMEKMYMRSGIWIQKCEKW